MNAAAIAEQYAGHPFIDYFDCLTAALEAARSRNKKAVRARLAGDLDKASEHQEMVHYYMTRVRQWHDMIDWSGVDG